MIISLSYLLEIKGASFILSDVTNVQLKRRDTADHSAMNHRSDHETVTNGEEHSNSTEHEVASEHDSTGSEHGGSGGHGDSKHQVPRPSSQLQLHMFVYKTENFKMFTHPAGLQKYIVGFTYSTVNQYDRYIIRIRYHGYEEYATTKMRLFRNETNELLLKGFLNAQYIVCVTLFSSSGLPEYPPLSTSDMCIDVVVGDAHPIGGHHSSTGLLSPLLFAVAAVLLAIITIGNFIKRSYLNHLKQKYQNRELLERYSEQEKEHKVKNTIKPEFSSVLLNRAAYMKWQGASRVCEIVENDSSLNLNNLDADKQNEIIKNYYVNKGLDMKHDLNFAHNLASLDSLSHVLNDKPWSTKPTSDDTKEKPVFYFSE